MRKINGEFCEPRRPGRFHWALLGILVVSSAGVWAAVAVQTAQLNQTQAEIARNEAASVAVKLNPAKNVLAPVPPWDASARVMLDQAGSRWPEALTALERAQVKDVLPIALSINVPSRTVTVELKFSDYPALLSYIEQLNSGDALIKWRLVQAQAEAGGGTSSATSAMSLRSRATISGTVPIGDPSSTRMR